MMKNRSLAVGIILIALLVALGAAPTYTALYLTGSSSGTATIQPPAAAGTPILTLPTATGTLATRTGSVTTDHCAKFDSSGRIIDAGGACGTFAAPDRTVTSCGSCTLLAGDMGGQVNYNGSSLTATIPAISGTVNAAGMQFVITNQHSTALTISTTPTLNGYSGSTIPQYGGLACTSNGTSLDCLGIGTAAAGAGGSVTTTGTPANGDIAKFSGSTSVTTATTTGSGSVVLATSPTLVTPALGTPSAAVLTNATGLPTTALTGTITTEKCVSWDSTTSVVAQTVSFPIEWSTYTITGTKSAVNGGGSFTANVKIGSTSVTSCSAINVSGATNTVTSCTAANTGSANDIINVVITSPSGTVNQAYVCPTFTHTVN